MFPPSHSNPLKTKGTVRLNTRYLIVQIHIKERISEWYIQNNPFMCIELKEQCSFKLQVVSWAWNGSPEIKSFPDLTQSCLVQYSRYLLCKKRKLPQSTHRLYDSW